MPDMMAIVSKAIFEKESPGAKPGDVLPIDVYRSTSKFLEKLDGGSKLFLVTVRPGDRLWLVAVLEGLSFSGKEWKAKKNGRPLTDVTPLIGALKFESGKGLVAAKGQLGMSLQTPRVLTAADVGALLQAAGAAPATTPAPLPATAKKLAGPPNLTAHEASSPLPCLCKQCLPRAPEQITVRGSDFVRSSVEAKGRTLHYWVPAELADELTEIGHSVRGALVGRLRETPS